jgi:hypothetical protein
MLSRMRGVADGLAIGCGSSFQKIVEAAAGAVSNRCLGRRRLR